jgi:hypothetical protein
MTDPSAVAQRQVQTETEKLNAKIADLERRIAQDNEQRTAEQQQQRAQHEAVQRAQTFVGQVQQRETSHPLTSQFSKRHGPQGLVAFANQFVAPLLHEGYSLDELHDHTEQLLDEMQVGATMRAAFDAPANGTSHPSAKNGAEQPITTLSGSIASERTMVVEDIPLARLPLSERADRLKAKLARK